MKKTIILITLTLSLLSCNKEDSTPNPNLTLSYANLAGKWYLKEEVMANGTVVPHENKCTVMRDYIEFINNGYINSRSYTYNCTYVPHTNEDYYVYAETNSLSTYGLDIPSGIVTKFTNEELRLQYDYDLSSQAIDLRTLVLTKN